MSSQEQITADDATVHKTVPANTDELRIEGTDQLLMQVIEDQAEDLEHGWRELIQNGLDSPQSTRVEMFWDQDRTIVTDNGSGVDLTAQRGQDLMTNLGESSKDADDDSTIGQFGIGRSQAWCKGRTAMISGDQALLFDIKGWGLDVVKCPAEEAAAVVEDHDEAWATHITEALEEYDQGGLTVALTHYDDEVPSYSYKWSNYENRIVDRFQFAELSTATRVEINGERISDDEPGGHGFAYDHTETFEGDAVDRAHISVGHNSSKDLSVYSNGVYVCDVDNRGLAGDIVVEGNLELNFARNGIQSGCSKWGEISERLDEIRADLFESIPDGRLNGQARRFVADLAIDGDERFADAEVLKTASGDQVSLEEARSRKNVGRAESGDKAADKLEEMGSIVLAEDDDASSEALEAVDSESLDVETYEADDKAESMGIHSTYERIGQADLSPLQRKQLAIAREIADRFADELETRYPDREVYYGKSDVAKAWTDGSSYVVITDSSTSSNKASVWVPELFRQLAHEFAHRSSSKESDPGHGGLYEQRYREIVDDHFDVLTDLIERIENEGLNTVVTDAPKY